VCEEGAGAEGGGEGGGYAPCMRDAIFDGSAKKKSVATHSRASATCLARSSVTPSKYPNSYTVFEGINKCSLGFS
jgi:hypothetical protein